MKILRLRIQKAAPIFLVAALLGLFILSAQKNVFVGMYETAALRLDPSAARAASYGDRHFDAQNLAAYDIERAEYFFGRALALDSRYPNLQHQLARIAFLRSDFGIALARINIELANNPQPSPSSYYVRGLIEGYMGLYDGAAKDYERYLQSDPNNWAALNDYAWVLLKVGRSADAAVATERGLGYFPDNAWLLNTSAIALYEIGDLPLARIRAEAATAASGAVTEEEWLLAYPGNDPKIAKDGIASLQKSSRDNMHTILLALASSTIQ